MDALQHRDEAVADRGRVLHLRERLVDLVEDVVDRDRAEDRVDRGVDPVLERLDDLRRASASRRPRSARRTAPRAAASALAGSTFSLSRFLSWSSCCFTGSSSELGLNAFISWRSCWNGVESASPISVVGSNCLTWSSSFCGSPRSVSSAGIALCSTAWSKSSTSGSVIGVEVLGEHGERRLQRELERRRQLRGVDRLERVGDRVDLVDHLVGDRRERDVLDLVGRLLQRVADLLGGVGGAVEDPLEARDQVVEHVDDLGRVELVDHAVDRGRRPRARRRAPARRGSRAGSRAAS